MPRSRNKELEKRQLRESEYELVLESEPIALQILEDERDNQENLVVGGYHILVCGEPRDGKPSPIDSTWWPRMCFSAIAEPGAHKDSQIVDQLMSKIANQCNLGLWKVPATDQPNPVLINYFIGPSYSPSE